MKVDLTPCFILHRRDYSETSLILEVFSSEHGRVSLVAKGAKRGRATQASLLQPVRRLNLAWSGRSELATLRGVEADGPPIRLDGRRLLSAFYMNELLLRLFHRHESDPVLFRDYADSLAELASAPGEDRVLRRFEKRLLGSLGYGLILDREPRSGLRIDPQVEYYYHFDHGPDTSKLTALEAVRVSGRTLQALNQEDAWDEDISRESKVLLRAIINSHLDNRPLHSRELYKAYLRNL